MTSRLRRRVFAVGIAGMLAFYLWGVSGLPAFGHYRGPYGFIVNAVAIHQTHATGVVSAVNFLYRGFDTLGEEFILFVAAAGVATVLREMRGRGEKPSNGGRRVRAAPTSDAVRTSSLVFVGPVLVMGWFLTTHAQTNPSGGFQGGVVMATAVILVFLAGQVIAFERLSPIDLADSVEAVGAGGFAMVGLGALMSGAAFLSDYLPLGSPAGAVDASGTIALISFFVGVEVAMAFVLIANELLEQAVVVGGPG